MNKNEFMKQLAAGLKKLPKEEIGDILADYEEYFSCASKEGRGEQELCERLGDPKKLAKEYSVQKYIETAREHRSAKTMSKAFFSTAGLGLVNFLYVVFVVVIGYIVIASLYIAVCSVGLGGIAEFAISIVYYGSAGAVMAWLGIFTGVGLLALSILGFIGLIQLGRIFKKGNMSFLNGISEHIKWRDLNEQH